MADKLFKETEDMKKRICPPKTWKELIDRDLSLYRSGVTIKSRDVAMKNKDMADFTMTGNHTSIERAAKSLLQIYQLIELGYGGNVTDDEWRRPGIDKFILRCERFYNDVKYEIDEKCCEIHFPAFHTKEQAEEFLSHPENIELLNEYNQIDLTLPLEL